MDESRREFLKKAGFVTLGLGAGLPMLGAAARAIAGAGAASAPAAKQWGMIIDVEKCMTGNLAAACARACHAEHNVPAVPNKDEEVKWIWTEPFHNVFFDQAHSRMTEAQHKTNVIVLCNHCASPSCVRVCPTKATWKRKSDGIVMMDMHRCIGCRYCMAACPYGSRSFNFSDPRKYLGNKVNTTYPTRTKGVVEKCDFCAEKLRLNPDAQPTCVETANSIVKDSMFFGDLTKPDSDVSEILRMTPTMCRRPSLGTRPNVFYIV